MARKTQSAQSKKEKKIAIPAPVLDLAPEAGFSHDEIAARARAIWLREGRAFGHQADHWFRAEHELRHEHTLAHQKSN